jgi:hypothetical protein
MFPKTDNGSRVREAVKYMMDWWTTPFRLVRVTHYLDEDKNELGYKVEVRHVIGGVWTKCHDCGWEHFCPKCVGLWIEKERGGDVYDGQE